MKTYDLINSLFNNDAVKFERSFNSVMAQKVSNFISDKRNDMAKTIFNNHETNTKTEV